MHPTDKLSLTWEDFQENTIRSFKDLRKKSNFSDVTLACQDGEEMYAHKLILSASSAFFDNILNRNTHPHPIIYMRGMRSDDLTKIVDFMYFGEASIDQDNLASFLGIAEDLKIRGLMGGLGASDGEQKFDITKSEQKNVPISTKETEILIQNIKTENKSKSDTEKTVETKISFPGHFQELDEKINSLMSMGNASLAEGRKVHRCIVCGKEGKISNIKQHIEAVHIGGISAPCEMCQKTYRSRAVLRKHMTKKHAETNIERQSNTHFDQVEGMNK